MLASVRCVIALRVLGGPLLSVGRECRWDGPRPRQCNVPFIISPTCQPLDEVTVDQALSTAMSAWSDVIDVDFVKTDRANLANSIDISFRAAQRAGGTLSKPISRMTSILHALREISNSTRRNVGRSAMLRAVERLIWCWSRCTSWGIHWGWSMLMGPAR